MQKATAWEANLYWRCHCGHENNHMWFYDGDSSYNFQCVSCGAYYQVDPPDTKQDKEPK
jgi:transcription elongation factor Elf1